MMGNLKRIHLLDMDVAYLFGKIMNIIQVTGKMTNEKEKVQLIIQMEIYIKEIIKVGKRKEKVYTHGIMGIYMMDIGKMI